jgi:superfamily II DNA or RNA helicase
MDRYKHQEDILELSPDRHLLCWGTGTGKTRSAVELACKNCENVLVVCPKGLKTNWKREIEKWHSGISKFLVVSKEEFRRDWDHLPSAKGIVIDEAHHFAAMTSQMTNSMLKYLKKHGVQCRWLLTATPYMSTPWNIYVLARHLGHEWNYMGFRQKFFYDIRMGNRMVPVVKPNMEKEISALVDKIGSTKTLDECVDVPEQTFVTEWFALNKKQEKMIKDIQDIAPIVRFTKQHQIENGTLKSDGYSKDEIIENDKFDRIIELCQENPKIAIFCRYNLQIDALYASVRRLLPDRQVFTLTGATPDKQVVVDAVEDNKDAIVLINASCSEGYELPSVPTVVYASLSFSFKDYRQSQGRVLRINKLKKNLYIHLIVKGGVDESVWDSIQKKQDFDIEIYAKGKRLPNKI